MKNLIALICVAALITVITGCSESIYSEQNGGNSQSPESAKMPGIEADLNPEQPKETLQPLESAETPKIEQEARINTELLSAFGMTLSELEEKYGSATSGRDDSFIANDGTGERIYSRFTYFFEGVVGGYTFIGNTTMGYIETDEQRTLPDGTTQIKSDSIFNSFEGQVKDLFLGIEREMTVEEFNKIFGVVREFKEFRESRGEYYDFSLLSPRPATWETDGWYSGFRYNNGYVDFVINIYHDNVIKPESVMQFVFA